MDLVNPPEKLNSIQRQVLTLRGCGYFGVQMNAILVPLLVFKLTGSPAFAALTLFFEWLPKLFFYIIGGTLTQSLGRRGVHITIECLRVGAFISLLLASYGLASFWTIAVFAGLYQITNALSNILCEGHVLQHWTQTSSTLGHAKMLQSDQIGCFAALLLGLLVSSLTYVALIAVLVQTATSVQLIRKSRALYQFTELFSTNSSANFSYFLRQFFVDSKTIMKKYPLLLASTGLVIGVPMALTFSALPFLIEQSTPGGATSTFYLSAILITRTSLSIATLHFIERKLQTESSKAQMSLIGLAAVALSCLVLALHLPILVLVLVVSVLGSVALVATPLLRTLRQHYLTRAVPPESRQGATGLLISIEAFSYLVAALLMSLLGNNLSLLMLCGAVFSVFGIALLWLTLRKDALTESL